MATQKQMQMQAISFRLPKEGVKRLRKQVQHTKWVQNLVLLNLGLCPLCGNTFRSKDMNMIEAMVKQNAE